MRVIARRRRLSIGARLTLASAGVMLLSIGVVALVVLVTLERSIHREGRMILRAYLSEVQEELGETRPDGAGMAEVATATLARLASLDALLRPSVAVFDAQGNPVTSEGILASHPVPLPSAVLAGEASQVLTSVNLGSPHPYLVAAAPAGSGFAEVAIHSKRFEHDLARILRSFALTTPLVLVLAGTGGFWISRRTLGPIAEITATARRIRGDDLDAQVPIAGTDDELDQLAVTLNEMIARIRSSMERLRHVSGDAAHQLRSPLACLRNRIEITLEAGVRDAAHRADLEDVLAEVVKLSDGVAAMLQLARSEAGLAPGQARPVELAPLLDAVVTLYAPVAEERGIRLRHAAAASPTVQGDASWLGQLLGNLIDNAIRYTEPGGEVQVGLAREGDEAVVRVADTGPGIPPEERERVFERFHRGGRGRESTGFGLGLAVAREIAREHGGRIAMQSRVGIGSVFTVSLPAGAKADGSVG